MTLVIFTATLIDQKFAAALHIYKKLNPM